MPRVDARPSVTPLMPNTLPSLHTQDMQAQTGDELRLRSEGEWGGLVGGAAYRAVCWEASEPMPPMQHSADAMDTSSLMSAVPAHHYE